MKGIVVLKQALAFSTLFLSGAQAHSWVEQLQRIAKNGTMIEPLGYQRGYVGRDNPVFKGDISDDLWQIPPNGRADGAVIYDTDTICSPQQTTSNYTSQYPQLVTAPGDYISMRHQENGHVSLPATQSNKPRNRGTIYIYGTEEPKADDALLSIHNVWTVDGTGGDGRGRLLATRNYDDGQCYQLNDGDISSSRQKQFSKVAANPMGEDLWCQADIQLPTDITVGANYTLYWVWDWPTLSKANAMIGDEGVNITKPEVYTSCMDLKIVDACSDELGDIKSPACGANSTGTKTHMANSFAKSQSYNAASVPQELTGNFAVSVEGASADSGSNDGMSAPPKDTTKATSTGRGAASSAHPSTFQTHTTSKTKGGAGGQGTVTIALSTIYVTQGVSTVTVTAGAQAVQTLLPSSANASPVPVAENSDGSVVVQTVGAPPSVTPFMSRRRSRIEYLS